MITKKEAQSLIKAMVDLRNSATDEQAKNVPMLYPKWEESKNYESGERIIYNNQLYKVVTTHIAEETSVPDANPSFFEPIE